MTSTEIWKEIPQELYYLGFKPMYEASNFGRIRNKKTGKVLKPTASNGNWHHLKVQLRGNYSSSLSFQVSHIIYTTFVGNCYEKNVKHRDGNPFNNMVDNLYV